MSNSNSPLKETGKLRYGMVGGGEGAFIGDVHRKAIALDGMAELVAGCFSRDFEKTRKTGKGLGLEDDRLYGSYFEMAQKESERKDGINFAVIVTPNNSHYEISKAFLECGIDVVCDKPLTTKTEEAKGLSLLAVKKHLLFCVTYAYTGYPIIKHARELILKGELGEIRFINAEYAQDWLSTPLEKHGNRQALWRTDPAYSGKSNCVGDIGSHIENMVSYVSGLKIKRISARLDVFGKERTLDDNATIMVDFNNDAKGVFWCSQIAIGHGNDLRIRIYGTRGSIEWHQEEPNRLLLSHVGKPTEIINRGRDEMYPPAQSCSRIPAGHPEGYFEAFANIYSAFISALREKKSGTDIDESQLDFPSVHDGIRGVEFIEKCVESSMKDAAWIEFS